MLGRSWTPSMNSASATTRLSCLQVTTGQKRLGRGTDRRGSGVATTLPTWKGPYEGPSLSAGPIMKIVAEFEESLKQYRPIAPGTPDPYTPPKSRRVAP